MSLNLHDWDMHDIQVKMRDMTLYGIITLYKGRKQMYSLKCTEHLQEVRDENKEEILKECEHLEKEICVIALRIADELSKES